MHNITQIYTHLHSLFFKQHQRLCCRADFDKQSQQTCIGP